MVESVLIRSINGAPGWQMVEFSYFSNKSGATNGCVVHYLDFLAANGATPSNRAINNKFHRDLNQSTNIRAINNRFYKDLSQSTDNRAINNRFHRDLDQSTNIRAINNKFHRDSNQSTDNRAIEAMILDKFTVCQTSALFRQTF